MSKENTRTHRRRHYFIEKKFQAKFILRFCILLFAGGLLTIGILYVLATQSTTVSIVNSRVVAKTTADFILPILIQTVIIVTLILSLAAIVLTLLVSHKIAGPLYRLKKTMQALEMGDFSLDFRLRRSDQLQDLSDAFNNMIKNIRQGHQQLKDNFISLKEKLDNISEQELPEHKRPALSELKKISQELNKIINNFKT